MVMDIFWGVLVVLLGAFSWTFVEYAMHNWVGHKAKGKNEFSREHLKHHAKGNYFSPAYKKILSAMVVLSGIGVASCWAFGAFWGAAYTFGFALGYGGYEWFHLHLHTHAPRGFYGHWARKHHFYHHFSNPKVNHGVTTPLWDWIFRTYEAVEQVPVPLPLAMVWLVDEQTGELISKYKQNYFLTHTKKKILRKTPQLLEIIERERSSFL